MSALIPPSQKARKLGLPSPRLDIPPKGSPPASSSSSDDTESAGPGAAAIGLPFHNGGSNISGHSSNGQPSSVSSVSSSSRAGPPKLSLPSLSGVGRTSSQTSDPSVSTSSSLSVAAGFENMSLEDDKTMRPGLVQVAPPPMLAPIPRPSGGAGKPKLGLSAVGTSRTASPARPPQPSLPTMPARQVSTDHYASVPSTSADHTAMTRTTSFEGALMAETSSAIIGDQEYKLSPSTLQDLGHLGEGASGEVRKTLHKPSGVIMAVKTIPASSDEDVRKQILRELAFNRETRADYIVRYFGAFLEDSDSQIAICMEYCEGGSLDAIYKQIRRRKGRTGEKVLGKMAESVLHGLVYLHDRKIIHRDIKPSNILVTRGGVFKLCDFGISGELINSMAGTFCGTSYYMAPERIRGARYNITADIWSLGLTIHEVAMNRFPFPPEGEPPLGPIELLTYIVAMDTPRLKDDLSVGVKWTKAVQDFVMQCLEKDPTKRPSPSQLLQHAWIKKSETWNPDLAAWVAQVWEW